VATLKKGGGVSTFLSNDTISLSIIIPVSRFIEAKRCLASLEAQVYPREHVEVMLVSAADLSVFGELASDMHLRLVQSEHNHPSIMRNLAVAASNGSFLAFLDDDTVVPPNWVSDIVETLSAHPDRIIGGPNVDRRQSLRFALANAIQEHPLLEGLRNHRALGDRSQRVNAHNLPLSNAAMTRKTFERIGGFNEIANYYMDGSEFLYIAQRINIPIYLYSSFEIQHDNRPMFLPYFKYKLRSRRMIGRNFILFPECYSHSFQIRLVFLTFFLSFPTVFALGLAGWLFPALAWGSGLYLAALYVAGFSFRRPFLHTLLLGPCVLLTQGLMYFGFFWGFIEGVIGLRTNLAVIEHKALRYRVIGEKSVQCAD